MARYDNWRKLSGDTKNGDLVNEGKKLLGFIDEQRRLSGNQTLAATKTMANGALVSARFVGGIPMVDVREPPSGAQRNEDTIFAYISSPGGLRIFDLNYKRLYRTITGLHPYEVNGVSKDGKLVYMTTFYAVRVDLNTLSAFAFHYVINGVNLDDEIQPDNRAIANGLQLSPDESKALVAFDNAYDPVTQIITDGLGGHILVDATTLAPLRPAIRMSMRNQASCYAPDGRFFIATSLNVDTGDDPTSDVTTSDKDYVSEFSEDGVHLSSRLLHTWGFTPDAGFSRCIDAVAVSTDGNKLYAAVLPQGSSTTTIYVLDLETAGMPVVDSMAIVGSSALDSVDTMAVIGDELFLRYHTGPKIIVINTTDFTITSNTTNAAFTTNSFQGQNGWSTDTIQPSPLSPHKFFIDNKAFIAEPDITTTLTAYLDFANGPVYTYDFDALSLNKHYRLVGVRGNKRSTA